MILRLPQGYDTDIGDFGTRLSGGQRQRVALARAIYGNPSLVILDEPNANLDSEGDAALVRALAELRGQGTTVIFITHRPGLIGCADKLLLLRNGAAEMFGPRREIVEFLKPNTIAPAAMRRFGRRQNGIVERFEFMSGALTREVIDVPVCVDADEIPKAPSDRDAIVAGCVVGAVFLIGFGGWAALAPLSSAAVAPGEIRVDSHRKTVQHMEDGIIRSILVREGDEVRQGQVLMQLDDTQAMANVTALEGQDYALLAEEARLTAERDNLPAVAFPLALERACADPRFASICTGQENIFADSKKNLDGRVSILNQQIDQLHSEIDGRQAQQDALQKQIQIVDDEVKRVKPLVDQNLLPQPRLLALQQQAAGLEGDRGEQFANIAKAEQEIGQTQIEIANTLNQNNTDIANDLRTTQDQIVGVEEKLRAAADVERRTAIVAPQSGKVVDLRYFTPGGVVKAGEPILDIVPQQDDLIVEAQVRPLDIEAVHKGLDAQIRLVAFPNHNSPTVKGQVTEVSADTLTNKQTGQPYYTAEVSIDARELARLKDVKLYPGMPADVLIVTGRRTLLDYLLDPLRSSFSRAFRES